MVRQEDTVLVLFRMREVVLRSNLSGNTLNPQYGWAHNKGYGSAEHMQAVLEYGATSWHRRSYEPVKSMHLPPAEQVPNKIIRLPEEADG